MISTEVLARAHELGAQVSPIRLLSTLLISTVVVSKAARIAPTQEADWYVWADQT